MVKLNLKAIEERVAPLGERESYDREFIFELLLVYGRSQSNVTRLRNGSLNVADDKSCEVAQKDVVYFHDTTGDPLAVIEALRTSPAVVRYKTPEVFYGYWENPSMRHVFGRLRLPPNPAPIPHIR